MKINFNDVNFNASESLLDFSTKKLEKLSLQIEACTNCNVIFKLNNSHDENHFVCEVEMHVPGNPLFASSTSNSFEKALDNVIHALKHQIEKYKRK